VCGEGAADCDSALGLLDLLWQRRRVEHMLCRAMPHGLGAVVRGDAVKRLEFLRAWRRATGSRVPFRALWRPYGLGAELCDARRRGCDGVDAAPRQLVDDK
jgi:hypothetical protein